MGALANTGSTQQRDQQTTSARAQGQSQNKGHPQLRIGISACLQGEPVRYNGGHSRSKLCLNELNRFFSYEGFCPELTAGFGVPRPTLRLVGDPADPRMVYSVKQQSDRQEEDVTDQFNAAIEPLMARFADLDGYILMKNSPSCGLERIKVYRDNGHPHEERSQGLFTRLLQEHHPNLPIEEEGRLHDDKLRENFVLRVFAYHHFRSLMAAEQSLGQLMDFHRDYKYVLMAHNQSEYRALGRLLGQADKADDIEALGQAYLGRFMAAIGKPASRGNHCNVMLHILGYLKNDLDSQTRQDIVQVIDQYREGLINLATPLTLLQHYIKFHGSEYIRAQRYLEPYPAVLGLTSQV